MNRTHHLKPVYAALLVLGFGLALARGAPGEEIITLKQLKNLTAQQASEGPPVHLKGVVVCYDAGWHQLYLHDGHETLYFDADDFSTQPAAGQSVELTGRARGTNVLENANLTILGSGTLPPAKRLGLADLAGDHGEWIEITGRVLTAETTRGRLALLLHDRGRNGLVYVLGGPVTNDFQRLLEREVRVRGINASKASGGRLDSALVFAPGMNEVTPLETSGPKPARFRWSPSAAC